MKDTMEWHRSKRLLYAPESREFIEKKQGLALTGSQWKTVVFHRPSRRCSNSGGRDLAWTDSNTVGFDSPTPAMPHKDSLYARQAQPRPPENRHFTHDERRQSLSGDSGVESFPTTPSAVRKLASSIGTHMGAERSPNGVAEWVDQMDEPPGTVADWKAMEEEYGESVQPRTLNMRRKELSRQGMQLTILDQLSPSTQETIHSEQVFRMSLDRDRGGLTPPVDASDDILRQRQKDRPPPLELSPKPSQQRVGVTFVKSLLPPVKVESEAPKKEKVVDIANSPLNKWSISALDSDGKTVIDRKASLLNATSMRSFKRIKKELAATKSWRRDRDTVDMYRTKVRWGVAILGLCGTACACLQHELVLRGWEPSSAMINVLKICNTVFSVMQIGKLQRESARERERNLSTRHTCCLLCVAGKRPLS